MGWTADAHEYRLIEEERFIDGVIRHVSSAFVAACLLGFVFIVFFLIYRRKTSRASRECIHPSMEPAVQEFRELFAAVSGGTPSDASVKKLLEARDRSDGSCPICFSVANFPILTNCGHVFCCGCIIGYWNHVSSPLSPVNCAICRSEVTVMLPLDWPKRKEAEESEELEDEFVENNIRLNDYNRKFSADRTFLDILRDVPVLIPYLVKQLVSYSGIMNVFRLRAFLCLLALFMYVLSPLDVIPESVYGFLGFIDDFFIFFLALLYLCVTLREFMAHRGEHLLE